MFSHVVYMMPSSAPEMRRLPVDPSVWFETVLRIAGHYRLAVSPEAIRIDRAWSGQEGTTFDPRDMARAAGLQCELVPVDRLAAIMHPPLLVEMSDGRVGVLEIENADQVVVQFSGDQGLVTPIPRADFLSGLSRAWVMRPVAVPMDRRVEGYVEPWRPDWLRRIVLADLAPYRAVFLASLLTNVLALAGIIFSMQVYDRVIPSQSYPTLYVLFGGVMIATLFGYLLRVARGRITDTAAKTADIRISDKIFGHALRVQDLARPRSTGTFIAQIRELEQIRDMMTSTTVSVVADVPFFLLFCVLFFYIAGPLVWIPLAAVVLMVLPGILAQRRLRRLAEENTRETALRSAMLVEAIQGLEDIKTLQAETRFQNLWNRYNSVTGRHGMQLRDLTNRLNAWAQTVQGGVFALVLVWGAPLVMAGELSTGVLVAGSMLASRMLAPLASVTQILNRWQQARVGRDALDRLLALPVDRPDDAHRIHKPLIRGAYAFRDAVFGHDPKTPVLRVTRLDIRPGERIAILGRNGSGKSTLLSALSGLLVPLEGELRIDDVAMRLVDPADQRRDIALMGQGSRLFHGSLRENLTLGAPAATDAEILAMLDALGAGEMVSRLPDGLDHMLLEGGAGLSGGQRQGLILARLLLRRPRVILLDEPTAALDESAEARVIAHLKAQPRDVGMVIATHRPAMLELVDRLIVLHRGQVVMDGSRDEVLARLSGGKMVS